LWILGLKTENAGTVIATSGNGKTELLGGLIYPAHSVPATDIGFVSENSQVSYMYSESVYATGYGYATQVQEFLNGVAGTIDSSASADYRMPLFVGFQ
jgi:hypothetical protein